MKNKKNILILLPLVLLIWGAVIYQFFSYSDPIQESGIASNTFELKPLKIKKRDTFSIDVKYRDPFLGKVYVDPAKKGVAKKNKSVSKVQKETVVWPSITYKGIVSDTKDKRQVYMLIINGKTYLMKNNETQEGVFLKAGNRFNTTVKYKNEWKTVTLQN